MTETPNSRRWNSSGCWRWLYSPKLWFLVALVVRLLYLLEQGGSSPLFYQPLLDEKEAMDAAWAVLHGPVLAEPYFKAPGYSWIVAAVLAITGNAWPWTIRGIQHVAGAWLVGLMATTSGRLAPNRHWRYWAIGVAGAIGAFYAPLIRLEDNLSLDFWAVFFQSLVLVVLVKGAMAKYLGWRSILAAGIFAAAAWLVRPTITLVLPFLAGWIYCVTNRHLRPLSRIALTFLFIVPIAVGSMGIVLRNFVVSGEPMLMPWQGGYNFYYANRSGASGRYLLQSRIVQGGDANPTRQLAIEGYRSQLSHGGAIAFAHRPNYNDIDQFWFHESFSAIETRPLDWVYLMARKFVYLCSDKEIYNYEDFDLQRSLSTILRLSPGRFGVVFPLALASFAMVGLLSSRRKGLYFLMWLYFVALGGAIALYYVSGRMRMPLAFPAIVLAGFGVGGFFEISMKRRVFAVVLCIAGIVISWGDWWGVRSESMAYADLARMSNAAWYRERYDQALQFALASEQLNPTNPLLPRIKAQALYGLGRIDEARREFEKSVQLLGDATSRKNLKVIDQELGK